MWDSKAEEKEERKIHVVPKSDFSIKHKEMRDPVMGNEMGRGASSHPNRYKETEVTSPLVSRQKKINFPRHYE